MEETREGPGFRAQRYDMSSTEFGPTRPETDQERQGPQPSPPASGGGGWTPRPGASNPPAQGGGWTPPPSAEPTPPVEGGGYAPPPPGPVPPAQGYPPSQGGYPPSQGGYPPPPYGGYPPPPSWSQPEGWNQPSAASPPPPSGRRRGWAVVAALGAAIVILFGGVGAGVGVAIARNLAAQHAAAQQPITRVPQANGSIGQNGSAAGQGSLDAQAIAKKVSPAVVDVNTVLQGSNGQSGEAAGTGIILTSNGQVLTNNHVIDGSTSIKVTVEGRSSPYTATVVGTDRSADVALLQLQGASGLPTATMADSSTVTVGEAVVALGNALGQGGAPSVTQGEVTALDQSITAGTGRNQSEQLSGLIQSDAPISPGDSGGPLVNSAGQVIGMITAGESQGFRRTTSTVGYAIPSNAALDVVNQIRAGGAGNSDIIMGKPGYLGVSVQELSPSSAARMGVAAGVQVQQVVSGSPAEKAGITADAVITAIDGRTVASQKALSQAIQSHRPGDQIRVSWQDQSGTHSATVTLMEGANA
jgi:S1-C subfamily serine protease